MYVCNISGGFGIDFSYNTDDVKAGVQKVAKGLLAHGVTAFCPTLVTSPPYVYLKVVSVNSFITLSFWCCLIYFEYLKFYKLQKQSI
jgi:N-acetylglucosamine-6-phosphate deacetylase